MTSHRSKIIMFLGDGMGGRDVPSLNGLTCIEAAKTPALDFVASRGANALMYLAQPGQPIGSDTAHMALLGYDPFKFYRGRGPFEARGVGLEMKPGDVAFRCNFATVDDEGKIIDRRAGRIREGTDQLAEAIMEACKDGIDGVQIFFKASVEHRAALVLRGEDLDWRVTDVDPHESNVPPAQCKPREDVPEEDLPKAQRTADVVNKFVQIAHEVLQNHPVNQKRREQGLLPANIVLPRGSGEAVHLRPFSELHGLTGAMIVEVDLVRGLGLYADMQVIHVPGATGGRDTDELAIAKAVADAWEKFDVVLCNIKAPDLGGHDRDAPQKIEAIEKVDRAVAYLLDTIDWGRTVLMVSADHCTPVTVGDHTGDPVPVALFGRGVRRDLVEKFSERHAANGGYGQISGFDALVLLRNLAGLIEKFGA